MRFKTGFVVGCAAGFYLTQKARQLRAPLAGRTTVLTSRSDWPLASAPGAVLAPLSSEKVRAIGDLARERATDLLRGPVGDVARERVLALFEERLAVQRTAAARHR